MLIYDRPPYIVKFQVSNYSLSLDTFSLVNVHLRPTAVLNESLELRNVVDKYKNLTKETNIAILGDLNFDCSYCSNKNKDIVRSELYDFSWYISDKVATTISTTSCAYDRILVTGDKFNSAIVQFSNKTYRYDAEFQIPPEEVNKIQFLERILKEFLKANHFYIFLKFPNFFLKPNNLKTLMFFIRSRQ